MMLGTGAEEGLGGGANPEGHAAGSAGPVAFPGMQRCMPGALHQRQLGTLTLQEAQCGMTTWEHG
jgi:hypothetical protein